MRVHHDKHHQAYVTRPTPRSRAPSGPTSRSRRSCRTSTRCPSDKQGPVRNNAGGHYNHSLFWEWMSPDGGGEPDGALAEAIDAAFGSFADFQAKLKAAGVNRFGSGWSWLVHDGSGLAVVSTPTRTARSATARRRCSASTSGSTPTT
jgi:Fe-Mn family superoxide dismutase